jgi:uncharacterized surface protein with fasciclin (FAS1) repeats
MSRKNCFLWSLALCAVAATIARAENTVTVGGEKMYPSKNIIENAVKSADHTTLVAAVKAAGLVETLQGKGPFTVFAPTNEAFAALPGGTVDGLLKPESKDTLVAVLTYHVVPGNFSAADIKKQADMNGGTATLKTVQGGSLKIMEKDGKWWVQDAKGGLAAITIADVHQSNGVIHVIDHVLMP